MTALTTRTKPPLFPCDPFSRVADAIGGLILAELHAKRSSGALARKVNHAMHVFFDAKDAQGRRARLLVMRHLIEIEAQEAKLVADVNQFSDDMISTTEAASILGFSRPYVVMLVDQKQLRGATLSAGGHRRIPRAAVLAWQQKQMKGLSTLSFREEGQETGAYQTPEDTVARRIKALTKKKR